jgi:type VI secretion system secreted protein Hcp
MGHCSSGTTIGDVVITFLRNFEGEMKLYRTITLSEVWVSRYAVTGSAQESDDMPLEEVTLDYSRIEDEFVQQTSDGAAGGSVSSIWDLKTLTNS